MNSARYQLTNGGETFETTLDAFFADNEYLDGTLDQLAIQLLKVGEKFEGDEGAGGKWTIARIS